MNARELLEELMPYLGHSGATGTLIKKIEACLGQPETKPEPAIRYNPILIIDVFEEDCEHKFTLNWVSSPVNWEVGQYKLSTVPPKPETKPDPITWLVMYKPSEKDFEFAEPNEKATNPTYWTDAFPVYAELLKREPLTVEKILDLIPINQNGWTHNDYMVWFARAIEREHDIKQ
jgi:hypothetical protein